ncbi:hypothetical protein Thiowin_04960 [Thiorhodovibrio winogradskyi]|uniref:Uncharacterized protein n=1 Tax=Thiorhodovibrio winogradskyi TaxID=77007 RepID=A0ABZ0SHT0_9GAMM|nr:hypothetical protein [Thiorhodovibrio winogradskyi]
MTASEAVSGGLMAVTLNGIAQLEYDRAKVLADYQGAYLAKMDERMNAEGIVIDGRHLLAPDLGQKAQFIAANLTEAITTNNEAMAAAMCSWLATRMPDLKQVKIREQDGGYEIHLDFSEAYVKQHPIRFGRPGAP